MLYLINTYEATFKNCENRGVKVVFMSTFQTTRKMSFFMMDLRHSREHGGRIW